MPEPAQLPRNPFTTSDLPGLGISHHDFRQMIREGLVRPLTRSVYAATDVPDTIDLRAQALGLILRPQQVVCDRTAAWLWGVDTYSYGELEHPPIEVAALRGTSPCTRRAVRGHIRDLAPEDITTIAGVRVTTPLRTALDLGCVLRRKDAMAALDAFRREHGLGRDELVVGSRRYRRRRGVEQLRELIPLSDPRAESARESWTRLAIIDAGLPVPDLQFWIEVEGVKRYRVDLAYPRLRIVIEYDGWEAHESTEEVQRATRERRDWLRSNGWTVIVVRLGDFTGTALDRWLDELRGALRSAYSNRRPLERGDRARHSPEY